MNDYVYRFYYIQRGGTEWEHEDFYDRRARISALLDAKRSQTIIAFVLRDGDEASLPLIPEPNERTTV